MGKDLKNLPHLKQIARNINHRLLEVERASQDCRFSQQSLPRLLEPTVPPDGQKAPGLKFGQPRVMAHPLRDKIQELDAVLERMLRNAHLQN